MDRRSSSGNRRASSKSGAAGGPAGQSPSGEPAPRKPSAARPSLPSSSQPTPNSRTPSAGKPRTSLTGTAKASDAKAPRRISGMASRAATKEEGRGSAVAATAAPPQITADALASINYAAFTQGSLSAKQRRARMLKDFLAAHSSGAQRIAAEWEAENGALWDTYLQSSHAPHSREIQRLLNRTQLIETSCQQRLQHANAMTRCALGGIEELLERLAESGTRISAETRVLSGEPDAVLGAGATGDESGAVRGTPLEEVRGFDPSLPDPHPPAFCVAEGDRAEVARLKGVFQRAMDSITARREYGSCADASPFSSPLKAPTTSRLSVLLTTDPAVPSSPSVNSSSGGGSGGVRAEKRSFAFPTTSTADDQERLRQVGELRRELNAVGKAFTSLMHRVERQHQHYQRTITAQRGALDRAATRTKLADDVLRDTVAQGEVEACSAVAEVQLLSLELRRRMDTSEVAMQAALEALIQESAEVCVANDALHDYAALTLNRENCLYAYMSRMERQVVEQADVLRQAQDTVTRLWSRLHAPSSPPSKGEASSRAQLGVDGCPTTSGSTSSNGNAPLPPLYQDLLRQCDRQTLLDLVEQLSHHSAEAAAVIVRGLDADQAHKVIHPKEAATAREAHQRAVATQQLLEKLDAEGHLRSNARATTLPLAQRVTQLVAQYDAYIDFNEQYARALVRQADVERREQAPSQFAFFDPRTPTPRQKGSAGSAAAAATPPKAKDGRPSPLRSRAAATSANASSGCGVAPALPYLQLWKSKQQQQQQRSTASSGADALTAANTGGIVNYLTHASSAARMGGNPDGAASRPRASLGGHAVSSLQPTPPPPALRRHNTISATATGPREVRTPPPPPVPPRAGLTSYVLSTYAPPAEETAPAVMMSAGADGHSSVAVGWTAVKRALPYRDGDRQFIEREREVFQQLD